MSYAHRARQTQWRTSQVMYANVARLANTLAVARAAVCARLAVLVSTSTQPTARAQVALPALQAQRKAHLAVAVHVFAARISRSRGKWLVAIALLAITAL